ncbi:MAG: hypothetical protein V4580_03090 [Bacteroidota bacterium]
MKAKTTTTVKQPNAEKINNSIVVHSIELRVGKKDLKILELKSRFFKKCVAEMCVGYDIKNSLFIEKINKYGTSYNYFGGGGLCGVSDVKKRADSIMCMLDMFDAYVKDITPGEKIIISELKPKTLSAQKN